ncbi:M48 family metalloprotease [Methylosinus sp. Sm6]|uniref:M48 family metalloprotease n=1 Tax=Methylosinus sp. Sm6 TaxID=2866948 RepID=UPI001C99D988|nr:M48 family metalloprotease [Methylosinus sp. Sm6]MBY6242016.1 M48 family metalloprotease [Methylosinus sp. Sm6]
MSFLGGLLPANGLFGHIEKNNAKSLLLLAAFLLMFEMLNFSVHLGGMAHARLVFERIDTFTTWLLHRDDNLAMQRAQTPAQKERAENKLQKDADDKRVVTGVFDAPFFRSLYNNLWWETLVAGGVWFAIAWLFFMRAVKSATCARPATRIAEPRVYNLVETLSILSGAPRPSIHVIESSARNAYAAGLTQRSAMIAVTRGLLDALDDRELEAVLAHELVRIKNNDIRLTAVASIFCGILFRAAWSVLEHYLRKPRFVLLLLLPFATYVLALTLWGVCVVIFGGWLARHLVAKARAFMADAGAVELTKDPEALASALRKIEGCEALPHADIAIEAMLFASPDGGPFSMHPSPRERIAALRGAIPNLTTAGAEASAAGRNNGITFAAVRDAIDRMPRWIGDRHVIWPTEAIGAAVILSVGTFIDPNLGVLLDWWRLDIAVLTGTADKAQLEAFGDRMQKAFNIPMEMSSRFSSSGASRKIGEFAKVAPDRKQQATLRTTSADCFPLGDHDPYDPGVKAFQPFRMDRDDVLHYRLNDKLGTFNAIEGEMLLERAARNCSLFSCGAKELVVYKKNLRAYIDARTEFVRAYDFKYGKPGLDFAQSFFGSTIERRLMEDLNTRIESGQIDPNEFADQFDALHLAAEKPPSAFNPCRTNAEWRVSAFPPPAGAGSAPPVAG